MKIIAIGDIHMDISHLEQVSGLGDADLVLVTGDLTNFGSREDSQRVLNALMGINPRVYAVHGNLDHPEVNDHLDEIGISLHGKGIIHGELGICGIGGSNPTPFNTPTEYPEEKIYDFAKTGYKDISDAEIKILVSHAPPFATATDKIDSGVHVGSKAIRDFIEQKQPDFCFTGHIHEARGTDRIGKTLILNPGMLKKPGWIELIKKHDAWVAKLNT